jgi:hypothetical protein
MGGPAVDGPGESYLCYPDVVLRLATAHSDGVVDARTEFVAAPVDAAELIRR